MKYGGVFFELERHIDTMRVHGIIYSNEKFDLNLNEAKKTLEKIAKKPDPANKEIIEKYKMCLGVTLNAHLCKPKYEDVPLKFSKWNDGTNTDSTYYNEIKEYLDAQNELIPFEKALTQMEIILKETYPHEVKACKEKQYGLASVENALNELILINLIREYRNTNH